MQPWDSILVLATAQSPYAGTAGSITAVTKGADGSLISVTARMDKDGTEETFPVAEVQRLG
ncbi:hypothetical protein AWB76_04067 [Caballeronia temeraria]|uniref:Uncharacterized protein n=1 Tax=Caballeronia temeraria TaxID=1777137 RepID=A0A158BDN3_9BURK|nr:hypothetical protein [Caballeronia temeraria]SAK68195.1 hypothetical protein AWB76_04067 [Caballeronia temeraria]